MDEIYLKIVDYLLSDELALAQLFKLLSREYYQKFKAEIEKQNLSEHSDTEQEFKRAYILMIIRETCSTKKMLKNKNELIFFLFSILQKTNSVNDVLSIDFSKLKDESILLAENQEMGFSSMSNNLTSSVDTIQPIKFPLFNVEKISNRKSIYKGVSRNGNKWQVIIMIDGKRNYIGSFETEEEAAQVYDIYYIKNIGNKRKLNFIYSPEEIEAIKGYQI